MDEKVRELLRQIPSMEVLLSDPSILPYESQVGRPAVKGVLSDIIGEIRKSLLQGATLSLDADRIRQEAAERLSRYASRSLRPVVNATGVVIHTNLGRSCLSIPH